MLVSYHHITWHHNPEGLNLNLHHHKNINLALNIRYLKNKLPLNSIKKLSGIKKYGRTENACF
jgi:hypothetical protein